MTIKLNGPKIVNLSKTLQIAVSFDMGMVIVDPRTPDTYQCTTTAIVRLTRGPKTIFAGVAVRAPNEFHAGDNTGKAIALARALQQLGFSEWREAYHLARKALRDIETAERNQAIMLEMAQATVA